MDEMYQLDIAQRLIYLILADCREEMARVHFDEAESEVETLRAIQAKAEEAATALAASVEQRERLLEACEALDAVFMPEHQAFDTLAVWAARDLARAAIAQAKGD